MTQPKDRSADRYDFLVIGSGPAGIHAAVQAAKLQKRVAIVEKVPDQLGGAWIHTGTIPSKTMREVLDALKSVQPHMGSPWVDRLANDLSITKLIDRARSVSMDQEKLIRHHITSNNIRIIQGHGRLEDNHAVRIIPTSGESFIVHADYILISTGSRPRRPDHIPFDGWRVVDSDELLRLEHLPRSILVFGAGVIGCEYACIFAALGVETTIIDARHRIMQTVDKEIAENLKSSMEDMGVRFKLGTKMQHLDLKGPQVITHFPDETITTDVFFFAAGRQSQTRHIGLERVGITSNERNAIPVNDCFQTIVPNIYAAGDVIGPPALAATSTEQGRIAACHAFGIRNRRFPTIYPIGVYTIPELSSVGKTEEELQTDGVEYVVGHASYGEVARGYIRGDNHGLLKILASKSSQQLLGIHIVGADACNLIHIGQCMMISGMCLSDLVNSMIFNYPTLAEAYRVAAFNALNKIFPSGFIEAPAPKKRKQAA